MHTSHTDRKYNRRSNQELGINWMQHGKASAMVRPHRHDKYRVENRWGSDARCERRIFWIGARELEKIAVTIHNRLCQWESQTMAAARAERGISCSLVHCSGVGSGGIALVASGNPPSVSCFRSTGDVH